MSYDIACKYSINFLERVLDGPVKLIPPEFESLPKILWLIGKFHIGGHREECLKKFSFDYNELVGRMSGELVETIWAELNWLKQQCREMSPESRIEVVSEAFNQWNFGKNAGMGESRWLRNARSLRSTLIEFLVAHYIERCYAKALVQVTDAQERVEAIEAALGTEVVGRIKEVSKTRGGEQYLPDLAKIQST